MWPDADLFKAVYDERGTDGRFAGRRVYSSFLQKLRPTARTFRALLPLYPAAIESFDLSGYDLVVWSCEAWGPPGGRATIKRYHEEPPTTHSCFTAPPRSPPGD